MPNLAIVTGGSRGLGKALIDAYRANGWTTLDLSRSGDGEHHLAIDLTHIDESLPVVEAQFQTLAKSPWERVVFISNAGLLTPIAPVRSLLDEQIVQNLNVNLMSAVRLIACFVRAFQPLQDSITIANISSGAALSGYSGWPLYCTAKAGMENFIRALAAEQSASAKPMTCINIDPGKMDTDMQAEIRDTDVAEFPSVGRFIDAKQSGQLRSAAFVAEAVIKIIDGAPENGERYRIPGAA
jgi:NAD(P)-dependent dehydrogenase (short-subunit alcohol dehydrogenase family)